MIRLCVAIFWTLFAVQLFTQTLGALEMSGENVGIPITGTEEAVLPPNTLHELKIKGSLGDPEAARKVYLHYAFGMAEFRTGNIWLEISAVNGSAKSALDLASDLIKEPKIEDRCRALYWARVAISRGASDVSKTLKRAEMACEGK